MGRAVDFEGGGVAGNAKDLKIISETCLFVLFTNPRAVDGIVLATGTGRPIQPADGHLGQPQRHQGAGEPVHREVFLAAAEDDVFEIALAIEEADGGALGGIEVQGPSVFAGYWQDEAKTRAEFSDDGWFRTGDLGVLDAAGYLRIVGRAKDLVISGASTCIRRKSRAKSTWWTACSRVRCSACRIRTSARA